jgi:hypothetical protein
VCLSYSNDLAAKHANDFRVVLRSEWYRRAFPNTRIDARKDTEAEVATTHRGYRLSTSTGGTLTGRGGQTIVIDDPLKPADAFSEPRREGLNEWFSHTLLSRSTTSAPARSSSSCSACTSTTSSAMFRS